MGARSNPLPTFLVRPLGLLPKAPALFVLERVLNVVFAEPLAEGEIDFLEGHYVNVSFDDAGIEFALSLRAGRLLAQHAVPDPELRIGGNLMAFVLLASRTEDPDTLFFRRELSTTGDTDLGLYLKNFLDGLEPETLPLYFLVGPLLRLGVRAFSGRSNDAAGTATD